MTAARKRTAQSPAAGVEPGHTEPRRLPLPPLHCCELGCKALASLGDQVVRGAREGVWRCEKHDGRQAGVSPAEAGRAMVTKERA